MSSPGRPRKPKPITTEVSSKRNPPPTYSSDEVPNMLAEWQRLACCHRDAGNHSIADRLQRLHDQFDTIMKRGQSSFDKAKTITLNRRFAMDD